MSAYLKVAATRLYEGPRAAPPPAQEFFVWLSTSYEELVLTPKERQAIAEVVRSGAALADLQLAAQRILVGLNLSSSYEHAGQKLAANLADKLVVIERERTKQAQYKQLEEAAARETQAALAREPDAQEKEGEPEEDPF
jgi:hypothetical protein